jgi:hypothetical protein
VGIGTATTTTALTIYKTDAANYHRLTSLYINTPQAGIVLDSTQSTSGRKWNLFANTTGSACTDGSLCIYDVAANRFNMVIDPSGNVGIGWTSPSYALDVGGTIRAAVAGGGWVSMSPGAADRTGFLNFYNSDASRTAYFGFADGSTMHLNIEQAKSFSILTNNALRMIISSGGNVGIGITNPSTTLHVSGTVTAGTYTAPGGNYLAITNGAGSGRIDLQGGSILMQNANVGIGTATPGYTLHVQGAIYASGEITGLSDKRYKTNVEPLTDSLQRVCSLQGVSYYRVDEDPDKKRIGLLAQDVAQVYPESVSYDDKNDRYSLNYMSLVAPLIEAIKELREEVGYLKDQLRQRLA